MASNNPASESTPLLNGHDPEDNSNATTWQRTKSWISQNIVYALIPLLFIVLLAVFLVYGLKQGGKDSEPPPLIPTPEAEEICTSAGCVLASATLLRSISPKLVASYHDKALLIEHMVY